MFWQPASVLLIMLWNDCDSCDTWLLFLIFSNLNGRLCLLQLYQLIYTGIINTNTIHVALRYFFRRLKIEANRIVCDAKQIIGRIIICRSLFIALWTFPPVKKSRTFTWTDPAPSMAYWNNELSCQTCKESCSNQYLCNWMSKSLMYGRIPVRAPEHLLLLALLIEIHGWGSKCPPVYRLLCHLTIWLCNMTWQELD